LEAARISSIAIKSQIYAYPGLPFQPETMTPSISNKPVHHGLRFFWLLILFYT